MFLGKETERTQSHHQVSKIKGFRKFPLKEQDPRTHNKKRK